MPSIEVLGTGVVYRNPMPHLCSRHAYFPSLVELPGGQLLCAMDIGCAFEAVDVRSCVCRSGDGGKTWSEPRMIFNPDESGHPVSTTCRISRMPDGAIVGLACLFDRSRADAGLSNPATDGFVRTDMAITRSGDGGNTWSTPQLITPGIRWQHFETCSPVIPTTATRWLAPSSLWPDWEGKCPLGAHKAVAFLSDDGGRTWPRVVDVMDGSAERTSGWEQKQVRLSDGRLMAVCWRFDFRAMQNRVNGYAFSVNNGESYGKPLDSPLHGETCTPVALGDNRVLCVYRRMDQRGLWAHLARIDGDRWLPLADAPLWGTNVEAHQTGLESILGQMSTLRFGCPSVIQRADGEVFAAFWCVEDCVSNIRWLRLKVNG